MQEREPTHALPPELVKKLIEAKAWYDQGLDGMTGEEVDRSNRKGADILMDIVEIIDRTWGFAEPLPKAKG